MGNVLSAESDDSDYPDLDDQRTLTAARAATELAQVARMKQGSLQVKFCDRNHVHLSVCFKVDAPVACRISSFTLASENADNGKITTETDAVPGLPVIYSVGLDQAFPYSTTDKTLHHIVDVKRMSTRHLRRAGNTYPLIIRIESVSSSFSSVYSKFDIRSLPHGGALPAGVNAHTIFAKFRFCPNGCWEIRVIHQKLWINGVGYDMPSVGPIAVKKNTPPPPVAATDFSPSAAAPGTSALPPAAAAAAALPDYPAIYGPRPPVAPAVPVSSTAKCVICHARAVQVMSSPCNHASMCVPCAQKRQQQLPSSSNYCPVCYKPSPNLIVLTQAGSPRGKAGAAA